LLGGNHRGAGQLGLADDIWQAQLAHQRHEDKQSAEPCAESARLQIEGAHVGNGGGIGTNNDGTVFIASSWQTCEALLTQEDGKRMNADGVAFRGEGALNVKHGQVLFAQRNGAVADQIAHRGMVGSRTPCGEKGGAMVSIVAELMAENAKRTGGIAEASRNHGGRKLVDEVSTQRLILALGGRLRGREELCGLKVC
jgi:hypothetical protein